jgi:hypothetical protein
MRCTAVVLACIASACLSPPGSPGQDGDGGDPGGDGGGDPGDGDGGGDPGADAGDPEPCQNGPLGSLIDDFVDDLDPAWEIIGAGANCTVMTNEGALVIDNDGADPCGVQTAETHAFAGQGVSITLAADNPNTSGQPDIVLQVYLSNWTFDAQYRSGLREIHNCPNGINCGTSQRAIAMNRYWRIRHDTGEDTVEIGFSDVGDLYDEIGYQTGADVSCAKVFIGSRGDTVGSNQIWIDGVNID